MIAPGTSAKRPAIVARAMERRGQAFLHSLAETCREWPELRHWLFEDFARNEKTRANFQALVESAASSPIRFGLSDLADEARGWEKEKLRLRGAVGANAPRLYGGRTWEEMEQLVYRYEGGGTELGVFVLARHWRGMGDQAKFAPELQRAGAELLDAILRHGEKRLLANLSRAVALLDKRTHTNLRVMLGYADWWKLQTVLYMLRNPQPAYRTREIRAYLAGLGLRIGSLDFRRFCKRHQIRRDTRAGRPRKGIVRSIK